MLNNNEDIVRVIQYEGGKAPVKYNIGYGTVKVGDMFFPSKEDFTYFVNKLTDIAEALNEGKNG